MTRREFISGAVAASSCRLTARPVRSLIGGRIVEDDSVHLPYDAEIEYLESTGTQWIDTGLKWDCSGDIQCRFSFATLRSVARAVFGYSVDSTFSVYSNGSQLIAANGSWVGYVNWKNAVYVGSMFDFSLAERKVINVGTQEYKTFIGSNDAVSSTTVSLFHFGGRYYGDGIRIHSYSCISQGDRIDLIPVRVGAVGYMYDKISGVLFEGRGTGNFVLGPDVN